MAATKKPPVTTPGSVLFVGWPDETIDAGELGIIQFDADATATVTQDQADWLAEQIAAGELPGAGTALGESLPEIVETGGEVQADLNACNKQLFDSWAGKKPSVEQIHDPNT